MSTSGTVGLTTVTVQNLIDDAARASGKLAEELTVEQVQSIKRNLFYLLASLINRGIQYFAIKKTVIGLQADRYVYDLPVGSNDALNVLYRTLNRPTGDYATSAGGQVADAFDADTATFCQQTSANGNISVNYGTGNPVYIGSIGILPYVSGGGSAVWTITLEYSYDNSVWSTLENVGTITVTDSQWKWVDITTGQDAIAYRVRASGGTTLALREFYLGNNSLEVQMARLNRDDYTNLPNKNFTANQPYQFWFNRTIPVPSLYLWPVPSDSFVQMTVWYSAQIEDVGALSGQLAIPDRWLLAISSMLAHRVSMVMPQVEVGRIQYLEVQAEKNFNAAEQEERDKSPIYWAPNISVYTA
jgi:hypothetical protein